MAAEGVSFTTSCRTSATPEAVASRIVEATAGIPKVAVAVPTSGTVIATRTYRPTWAIALAVFTSILFLAGLLFLLVKRTEAMTISLSAVDGATAVTASGSSDEVFVTRLISALNGLPDVTDENGGAYSVSYQKPSSVASTMMSGG